jgi:carbon-monoxide dehydrogenase medium subunit
MATVGGNLCNASPSADTAQPLLVFGASTLLVSTNGERTVPLEEFFTGPSKTVLQPGELLKELVIPVPAKGSGSAYVRHIPRAAMDISVVGVAVLLTLGAGKRIHEVRIALGAVAPTPIRAHAAERLLEGQLPEDDLFAEAGTAAAEEARPVDDVRASVAYRRHLIRILTQDALRQALANIKEEGE